ncbi:MAG: AAA family ATPase [Lachnospiraceae bacterium]|nr:AAA family ATPase [Lachnospiraceae bacterium]
MIARKAEQQILEDAIRDDRSHFIAIYGRRRVGKTYLVREVCKDRFTFSHAGLSEGGLNDQILAFDSSIKDAGGVLSGKSGSWLEAFDRLKELVIKSSEKKKILFLDELSWMDTPKSRFVAALEHFWNGWASARNDIILIVCASATSWMLDKVIHNRGGLYNRLTEQIRLEPFSLSECEEYARFMGISFGREQILLCYMVFGGVPYYWSFLRKGQSLPQNLDRLLFSDKAPLRDEFNYLYASIFKNPSHHIRIIETLARKKIGMTREELIERSGLRNSGDLTKKLEELESCGFIRRYNAYGSSKKNAVYQLIDCFTLFYYSFMENRTPDEHFWVGQLNTPLLNTWTGLAFERICLLHIAKIKEKLGISGVHTEVCAWCCKADPDRGLFGSQIDLLIVRQDRVINLCEIKYSGSDYTITEKTDRSIRNKIHDLITATGTRAAIHPTLITSYGLVENSYAGNIQNVITMDDLF